MGIHFSLLLRFPLTSLLWEFDGVVTRDDIFNPPDVDFGVNLYVFLWWKALPILLFKSKVFKDFLSMKNGLKVPSGDPAMSMALINNNIMQLWFRETFKVLAYQLVQQPLKSRRS